jgi:hypothetical protein
MCSRAVVRKGDLRFVERVSVAGHILRLMDEGNSPLDPARAMVWLGGHCYRPDAHGDVIIPFSSSGEAKTPIVLTLPERAVVGEEKEGADPGGGCEGRLGVASGSSGTVCTGQELLGCLGDGWSFSTLASLTHMPESYALSADMFVNR